MPQTYKFVISMPVLDTLPRNRISNTIHMEHVAGGVVDTDLEDICADLVAMYGARYGNATKEIKATAYDVDAVPNYPRASVVVNAGAAWACTGPTETALCLSFAGPNRGNKSERGRIYLMPQIATGAGPILLRPTSQAMDWALDFYTEPNGSFPDIGGIDWKFGIWSKRYQKFRQSTQAWVNDDWDHVSRRSTRETTRMSITRDG